MSSAALAHSETRKLGELLAPNAKAKVQIDRVYRELGKRLDDLTWRRVRSFFFAEAARADYEEIQALRELRAEEEVKRAKQQLAATANLLAAHHDATGSTLDRDTADALRRLARHLDIPRDGGDVR